MSLVMGAPWIPPQVTTPSPSFTQGQSGTYDLSQHVTQHLPAGATIVTTYALSGSLGAGLSLNASTGLLSYDGVGAASSASHTLTVTDSAGATDSASFTLSVNGESSGNWADRSTATGVVMATNFDVAADVTDFAIDGPWTHETTEKLSGGGAAKVAIADSDTTSGHDWWRYLNDTMEPFGSAESGLDDEYYVSYSVYIPHEYYNWCFDMSTPAHKKFSITSQKPSNTVHPITRASQSYVGNPFNGSSVNNELVVNDFGQRMHPMIYMNNPDGSARAFDFNNTPENFDFRYMNAVDEGVQTGTPVAYSGDTRSQAIRNDVAQYGWHNDYASNPTQGQSRFDNTAPFPDPIAAGPNWRPGWNHFKYRVKFPTTWTGTDGIVEAWMAHPGDRDWTKWLSVTGTQSDGQQVKFHDAAESSQSVPYNGGTDGWYHVGIWLTPFRTGGQAETGVRPDSYLIYDELICSTQDIAAPVSVPSWHPADNEMIAITPATTLSDVQQTGGSISEWAIVNAWTTAFAGPDIYGFASQGGHFNENDSGVYALQGFMGDTPPVWQELSSHIASPTANDCALQSGKPIPSHGYNAVTADDEGNPILIGRTGRWSDASNCPQFLKFNVSSETWSNLSTLASGGDLAGDYDPVTNRVWHIDRSDAQQAWFYVDADSGAQTQVASMGVAYDSVNNGVAVDYNRRIALFRSTNGAPVYRVLDLENPNNSPIVPSIPSFAYRDGNSSASFIFCEWLGTMGAFVLWDGGGTFYTMEPPSNPLSTTEDWRIKTINVSTPNGSPTEPSTGFFKKLNVVKDAQLLVCQSGNTSVDNEYYITRLIG